MLKHVECAHIKNISDFKLSDKLSDVNHIDNLIWLCPNHHWEFDFGELALKEIKNSKFYHNILGNTEMH